MPPQPGGEVAAEPVGPRPQYDRQFPQAQLEGNHPRLPGQREDGSAMTRHRLWRKYYLQLLQELQNSGEDQLSTSDMESRPLIIRHNDCRARDSAEGLGGSSSHVQKKKKPPHRARALKKSP
nr:hypothetical protein [Pontibacter sp. HSC-14F20]